MQTLLREISEPLMANNWAKAVAAANPLSPLDKSPSTSPSARLTISPVGIRLHADEANVCAKAIIIINTQFPS